MNHFMEISVSFICGDETTNLIKVVHNSC